MEKNVYACIPHLSFNYSIIKLITIVGQYAEFHENGTIKPQLMRLQTIEMHVNKLTDSGDAPSN